MKDNYVSASEIDKFSYCERSWWYWLHEEATVNQPTLDKGRVAHDELGQQVRQVEQTRNFGLQLIWVALALLVVLVIIRVLV